MSRPTLALCCILKNEINNIERLLQSVEGCFDEIHFTDTGSTDGSIELIQKLQETNASIHLHHFPWVNDFSAARNYSFSHPETDYLFWMDLDDVLSDPIAFIKWRDEVMGTNQCWTAIYNYSYDDHGNVVCSFIRERALKRNYGFKWTSFVHEGCVQVEGRPFWNQHATTWTINHMRSEEDVKKDKKRNLNIFEQKSTEGLEPRMVYYYGKELFENGLYKEASRQLMDAIKTNKLETHDLVVAIQYAAMAALQCGAYPQALQIAFSGLQLLPTRAEYLCIVGDVHFNTKNFFHAIPYYEAALKCSKNHMGGTVFIQDQCYDEYPLKQLSRSFYFIGKFDEALAYAERFKEKCPKEYTSAINEINEAKDNAKIHKGVYKCQDIVIICPPIPAPEWDEDVYHKEGLGGSETACVEVAMWLKKLTGQSVKVFNTRQMSRQCESGVEYYPLNFLMNYLKKYQPQIVLNWRHAVRMSEAPTYVWAHDLVTPGIDQHKLFDGVICLSEFHRDYAYSVQGVPNSKAVMLRNGINPEQIYHKDNNYEKIDGRIIWPSSPDRGLDRVIEIIKRARIKSGINFTLDVFYGTDNMRRMGMLDEALRFEKLASDNKDFVNYYGNVDKATLYKHWWQAQIWLYPANFIETFCISAIEALSTKTYPIVRDIGALKHTLKKGIDCGMVKLIEKDILEDSDYDLWADELIHAYESKAWEKVNIGIEQFCWESVTREFIDKLRINDGNTYPKPD